MFTPEQFDRFYGTIIGAAVGDAAGATLEFYRKPITSAIARNAITMPGGGTLDVGPGQQTDDFELTRAMCLALHKKNPVDGFPLDDIAVEYIGWYISHPFDMGNTCARAFTSYTSYDPSGPLSISQHMINKSLRDNIDSEANGALMRCSPIAIWGNKLSEDEVVNYAKMDAQLSHPSEVCQDCNAVFVLAIHYLINHPGDAVGAIEKIETYVRTHQINQKVHDWVLQDSKLPINTLICTQNIGWVRHAFILAIHFLRNVESYTFEQILEFTLMKGGDTDTNASIVCALMGAYYGDSKIPLAIKNPVLQFRSDQVNYTGIGWERPIEYTAYDIFKTVNGILCMDDSFDNGFRCTKTYYEDHYLY